MLKTAAAAWWKLTRETDDCFWRRIVAATLLTIRRADERRGVMAELGSAIQNEILKYGLVAIIGAIAGFVGGFIKDAVLQHRRGQQEQSLEDVRAKYTTELEQLRTQLERASVVHRAHFEAEFRATRLVWRAVAKARSEMAALRPESRSDINDSEPEQLERFLKRRASFQSARNALVRVLDSNSPFLAPAVFVTADAVRGIVVHEALKVRSNLAKPFTSEWYGDGQLMMNTLEPAVELLSATIRARFAELNVKAS